MIPLDYQNPQHVQSERPRQFSSWGPYIAGAGCAVVLGLLMWGFILGIWPHGRWQILEFPDLDACGMIGMAMLVIISAIPYELIADRRQTDDRCFIHGVIGGLWMVVTMSFIQRLNEAQFVPAALLDTIFFGGLFIIPALLGCLSRHEAKRQVHVDVFADPPAQQPN